MSRLIILFLMAWLPLLAMSQPAEKNDPQQKQVEALKNPLYSPFIERYMLDELKQLRVDMAAQKNELLQQVIDRELTSVDRGVTYATNAITYFFYLIAGTTSILLLVGWTSIKDMKERVQLLADEKISELVNEYEQRLAIIEQQLNQKTLHIEQNREEIELTREMQSLWLRAGQDTNPANKIAIYDHILKLSVDDCEALTYKADAVLELGEPQWAANLCHQALKIDPDNGHAFYQLACACTVMGHFEEAVRFLSEAFVRTETYRDEIAMDPMLLPLKDFEPFKELLHSAK